ncbi:MAG: JAB domain-containing protein, partial [Candidatus Levybacteria bacterium]|nr:JAB domain-containing protein [Candidatus Levybacteria bacterium]
EINDNYKITEPEHTLKYLKEFQKEDREFFIVLGLDTQNKVLYRDVVSIGTLNCILIHPREVFKSAIMKSVNSIIIAHNHPSGSQDPSKEDLEVLETLKSGADILDIKILDALIITSEGVFSFKGFKEVF